MATRKTILVLVCSLLLCGQTFAGTKSIDVLKQHYTEFLLRRMPSDSYITRLMRSLKPDGSWPDLNYQDRRRSSWDPSQHVRRVEEMAKAYRNPDSALHGKPELKAAILSALGYWLKNDFTCPNWWPNRIGVPRSIANVLVLMGNEVPHAMVTRAMKTTLARSKIGMTGQNKVWLAGNVFVRSMLTGNEKQMRVARDTILSQIRVTTEEGVQPDWSFHQHGPQLQTGNYGKAFADSITQWGLVFRDTSYALDAKQLSIMRHYLLQGTSWIMWHGYFDLSACGRQLTHDCQINKAKDTLVQLKRMIQIDPAHAAQYKAIIDSNRKDGDNTFVGNKQFWRSDMMVHRRPTWYASVKMSSKRVVGAETVNREDMRGLHLADGALYVYQTGREYENIQPFWDWHRLPGTTCDQSIQDLEPGPSRRTRCQPPTSFVGGVTDGQHGVAAMNYKRRELTAHKSWFFLDNAIVCLGAGIHATQSGPVWTSIQQSLLQGPVTTSSGTAAMGKHTLKQGDWVDQANIGYLILKADKTTLQLAKQRGNWKRLFGNLHQTEPASGDVFSLWIDHGQSPDNQSYAYAIFPQTSPKQMATLVSNPGFKILSNTADLQAIEVHGSVQAVFYKPGKLQWAAGRSLEASKPCIVMINASPTGTKIYVSDPTEEQKQLKIIVDGHIRSVNLPQGGFAGKTVELQ